MRKGMLKTLLIVLPILLLFGGGAAYGLVRATTAEHGAVKVRGALVPLGDEFVVNLAGGHYAKVSVALLLVDGSLPRLSQSAVVRAVVTDELTGIPPDDLIDRSRRHKLIARLKLALQRGTDEPIKEVLLTDIAVQ
jgi:flagellar basal body-associated protein FliL